jgi:hypothetical protein
MSMHLPTTSPVDADLAHLKRELADETAPDFVWVRLAEAASVPATSTTPPRPNRRPRYWFLPPVATLAVGAWFTWVATFPAVLPVAPVNSQANTGGAFIALKSLESPAFDMAEARVVSTEVPRIWLASAGVPVAPERASEPIQIDLLVSQAGQALAFRIPNL